MKILIINLLKFFAVILLQVIFVNFAVACLRSTDTSAKRSFEKSENIIIAKLKFSPSSKHNSENDKAKTALNKLKVEKVYKGNLKVGEELEFEDFTFRCGFDFDDTGKEYLLYLSDISKQSKFLEIVSGSRSAPLKASYMDIIYLEKEEKVRDKNRLFGIISFDKKVIFKNKNINLPSLANRKVYIVGEKGSFVTKTNERGVYEIYDLPTGNYSVYTEQISGWISKEEGLNYFMRIKIGSSDHMEKSFWFFR